jgi:hypothetical protein
MVLFSRYASGKRLNLQGVIAAARNAGDIDIWSGILMIAAVAILLLPLLAIPFIFGGFKAKKLKPKLSPELLKVSLPSLE